MSTTEPTLQEQMKAKLETLGLPFKYINVYGRQIVVTCASSTAASKWASVLMRFATLRGSVEATEPAKQNKNTVLRPTQVRVWKVYAAV